VFVQRALETPEAVRAELLAEVERQLGAETMRKHFMPHYPPWRQRVAFIPDGDLFAAIRSGQASVVTDEIDAFTETGMVLKSGQALRADVVIAATGLNLSVLGDVQFEVDGQPVDFSRCVMYRGAMFTGVPNMLWVFGYFRASWTLRVDLLGDYFCRLLHHMDAQGLGQVMPQLRDEDQDMERLPWVDPASFNPGYLTRVLDRMPRQGDRDPWQHTQDYWRDAEELPRAGFDDGALRFEAAVPDRATTLAGAQVA
jgi:cation diffusion facilitator CzcD-associated flavoprotein CzcO